MKILKNKLPRSKLTRYSGTSPEEFVSLSHSSVQQAGRYSASRNKRKLEGQAVLIIILVVSVVLVIGLSLVSRSVTDIKISQQTQEAARALNVAQSGLEQTVKTGQSITSASLENIEYSTKVEGLGGGKEFVFPESYKAGESVVVWLVDHTQSGEISSTGGYAGSQIRFFWGNSGTRSDQTDTPALEAVLVYKDSGGYKTKRFVYDPNSTRRAKTKFTAAQTSNCQTGGKNFAFCSGNESLPSGTKYFVRIRLLFNGDVGQVIGVSGDANLPNQGNCYLSTATVTESGVTKSVRQCKYWGVLFPIFDNLLYSESAIGY